MPQTRRAVSAPDGLAVRLTRHRRGDLYLREWRAAVDHPGGLAGPARDWVMLHGIGVSSEYFERLAYRLAVDGDVHMLDLPGFAGVPAPDRPVGIPELADLVAAWLRRSGLRRPALLGHSMGAQVVTELAARHPDLVGQVVLVGPPVNAAERGVVPAAARLMQSSVHESSRTRRIALAGYARCGLRWFAQMLPDMVDYPIEQRVAAVTVPGLVIRGEHDAVCPPQWARLLADRLPEGRVAEVPGAGHGVIHDHSDVVAELVTQFLDRVAGR